LLAEPLANGLAELLVGVRRELIEPQSLSGFFGRGGDISQRRAGLGQLRVELRARGIELGGEAGRLNDLGLELDDVGG
jgi:hypothetical protein